MGVILYRCRAADVCPCVCTHKDEHIEQYDCCKSDCPAYPSLQGRCVSQESNPPKVWEKPERTLPLSRVREMVRSAFCEACAQETVPAVGVLGNHAVQCNQRGNPTARSLAAIVRAIREDLGIMPRVAIAAA